MHALCPPGMPGDAQPGGGSSHSAGIIGISEDAKGGFVMPHTFIKWCVGGEKGALGWGVGVLRLLPPLTPRHHAWPDIDDLRVAARVN